MTSEAVTGRSIDRMLRYAVKYAAISTNTRAQVGAVLFKGNKLISGAWNDTRKTHPASPYRFKAIHAEFGALLANYKIDVVGSTMFVARIDQSGKLKIAKPCSLCEELVLAAGVRKIYYTDRDGSIRKLAV